MDRVVKSQIEGFKGQDFLLYLDKNDVLHAEEKGLGAKLKRKLSNWGIKFFGNYDFQKVCQKIGNLDPRDEIEKKLLEKIKKYNDHRGIIIKNLAKDIFSPRPGMHSSRNPKEEASRRELLELQAINGELRAKKKLLEVESPQKKHSPEKPQQELGVASQKAITIEPVVSNRETDLEKHIAALQEAVKKLREENDLIKASIQSLSK